MEFWEAFTGAVTSEAAGNWFRAGLLLLVGIFLVRLLASSAGRSAAGRWGPQGRLLASRAVTLVGWTLLAATILRQLGFELGVLMGAAGVFTVAIGFASQTAASNLISGMFLVGERPFVIGDVIEVDTITGEVISIDMVSVKLRTFDNLLVRVPNEMLLKSRLTNNTHFPIRRADILVGVSYGEDIPRVFEVLREVANRNPLVLDEPEPALIHRGFGDSSINIQFSVWAARGPGWLEMRTSVLLEIKQAFDAAGIEIPFPQRALSFASTSVPFELARPDATGEPPAD